MTLGMYTTEQCLCELTAYQELCGLCKAHVTATSCAVHGMAMAHVCVSRNIEWDAVEAPSQMQEKWVYDKNTFNSFAKHWQTGKPVPEDLFQRIKAMRTYRKGEHTAGHSTAEQSRGGRLTQQHTLHTVPSCTCSLPDCLDPARQCTPLSCAQRVECCLKLGGGRAARLDGLCSCGFVCLA